MALPPYSHVPPGNCPPTGHPVLTCVFIANLHCNSCCRLVHTSLRALEPAPYSVSVSILSHSVSVSHPSTLSVARIEHALHDAGFTIHCSFSDGESLHRQRDREWVDGLDQAVRRWRESWNRPSRHINQPETADMGQRRTHVENCAECRAEAGLAAARDSAERRRSDDTQEKRSPPIEQKEIPTTDRDDRIHITIDEPEPQAFRAELSIGGMTCSACVGAITQAVQSLPFVRTVDVSLLTNSATVVVVGEARAREVVQAVEDAGFDASLESVEPLEKKEKEKEKAGEKARALWKAEYSIGGMTCSACSNAITGQLEQLPFVESVSINVIGNSGTVVFEGQENLARVTEAIEDAGFDATVDRFEQLGVIEDRAAHEREVFIRVDDMFCHHCPATIHRALADTYGDAITIVQELSLDNPVMKIKYTARPPDFTIRHILATISAANAAFQPSIHHPPTIEDRSKALLARERRRTYIRLALAVSTAVPAFIIGVVCMSIMVKEAAVRRYMMRPMWVGRVSRAEWALFILATPVYFFAASGFHVKALKEVRALWRPGSTTPILHRFTRFGSMNMLMSLGTSVAYFSSIAELVIEARQNTAAHVHHHMNGMMDEGEDAIGSHNYFDSVIFLTMFLLLGRSIEAYAKAKTGDAIAGLRALRPSEAILVEETDVAGRRLSVDELEVGDCVLVPHGASPPFDGVVIDGAASFDESSLTGESRLVAKAVGDAVYSGTVNRSSPVQARLTSISGQSMLDQIIKIVREGQTRRAPVERAADLITAHFVPFVVAVGIVTWAVWLGTGLSGALPAAWVEGLDGGWPLWALRFAIAVFVVACPCGIGLAAPTALFVGGGLAAQHGILVKGGGEAFQEASALDCVVFDMTGTLTNGGEPKVVAHEDRDGGGARVLAMVRRLEESSSHPVARALVQFASEREAPAEGAPAPLSVDEVPGKGMTGRFRVAGADVAVLVGNEALLNDHGVPVSDDARKRLNQWAENSHSVVLVATRTGPASDDGDATPGAEEEKAHRPRPARPGRCRRSSPSPTPSARRRRRRWRPCARAGSTCGCSRATTRRRRVPWPSRSASRPTASSPACCRTRRRPRSATCSGRRRRAAGGAASRRAGCAAAARAASGPGARSWPWSATESTTRRRSRRPTSASPSAPGPTWPCRRPRSCSSRRTCAPWPRCWTSRAPSSGACCSTSAGRSCTTSWPCPWPRAPSTRSSAAGGTSRWTPCGRAWRWR